jgi:hypothetical protein
LHSAADEVRTFVHWDVEGPSIFISTAVEIKCLVLQHPNEQNAVLAPNVDLVSYKEISICDVYNININANLKLQELTSTAGSYIALQKYKDYDRTKEGCHPTIRKKNSTHFILLKKIIYRGPGFLTWLLPRPSPLSR